MTWLRTAAGLSLITPSGLPHQASTPRKMKLIFASVQFVTNFLQLCQPLALAVRECAESSRKLASTGWLGAFISKGPSDAGKIELRSTIDGELLSISLQRPLCCSEQRSTVERCAQRRGHSRGAVGTCELSVLLLSRPCAVQSLCRQLPQSRRLRLCFWKRQSCHCEECQSCENHLVMGHARCVAHGACSGLGL